MTTEMTLPIPAVGALTVSEMMASLKARGYHCVLLATESGRDPYIAYIRGSRDFGGATADEALVALVAWVDAKAPPTTRQLRKAGVQMEGN